MSVLHGVHRSRDSHPAEGFTLHRFGVDDIAFKDRAMHLNRGNTAPRRYLNAPEVEPERIKAAQRQFRQGSLRSIGLIATHYNPNASAGTEGAPAVAEPADVGYGHAGITRRRRGEAAATHIVIENIFGARTLEGFQSVSLIARQLLLGLRGEMEGDMQVTDPKGALRMAFAQDWGVQDWPKPDGIHADDYSTIVPTFSPAWQDQLRVAHWSMGVDEVLEELHREFPGMPPYEYQDHRGHNLDPNS